MVGLSVDVAMCEFNIDRKRAFSTDFWQETPA
jgi:hypothetical protein